MNRREFLRTSAVAAAGAALARTATAQGSGEIMTVLGPITQGQMGVTLPHEHVLVDFIGADQVDPSRYDQNEAFNVILPHLQAVQARGLQSFVEATPDYLARDVVLLRRLAQDPSILRTERQAKLRVEACPEARW